MRRFICMVALLVSIVPGAACGLRSPEPTPTPTKTPKPIQVMVSTTTPTLPVIMIPTLTPTPVPPTDTPTPAPPTDTPTPEPTATSRPRPAAPPPTQPPAPAEPPPAAAPTSPPPAAEPPPASGGGSDPIVGISLPGGSNYDQNEGVRVVITVSDADGVSGLTWGVFTQNLTPLIGGNHNCGNSAQCNTEVSFNATVPGGGTAYIFGVDASDTKGNTHREISELYVH